MNLAHLCLRTAVVLGFIGFSMGFGMGVSQDFSLAPAHAHMNLLGWVSFFLYGAFYFLIPQAAIGMLPRIHYIMASVGTIVMVGGIAGIYLGYGATFDAVAIVGSISVYASFILFVFIVFLKCYTTNVYLIISSQLLWNRINKVTVSFGMQYSINFLVGYQVGNPYFFRRFRVFANRYIVFTVPIRIGSY